MPKLFARIAVGLFAAASPAFAAEVVDQSNTTLVSPPSELGIGANLENPQSIAQTFTVGVSGALTKLRLPLACGPGNPPDSQLALEIRRQGAGGRPDGALLGRTDIAVASLPLGFPATAFHEVTLAAPITVSAGDALAFTLASATANCAVTYSPPGETYTRGDGFFKVRPDYPDWVLLDHDGRLTFAAADLAFETIIDTGGGPAAGGDCSLPLPGGGSIPSDAPICRCVGDAGLREFRCALLHPDFFAIRRIPWPIPAGVDYRESWEILPMTKLKTPINISLSGANIPKPVDLSFTSASQKVLQKRQITLKAPAAAAKIEGAATLSYGGAQWRFDRSIPAEQFAKPVEIPKRK